MTTKKKVVLTVLLGVLVALGVYLIITAIPNLTQWIKYAQRMADKIISEYQTAMLRIQEYIIYMVFAILSTVMSIFFITYIWKNKN
ncbi:MAG: hypothetical protein J6V66_05675 [Clostridia bacterium]|nr:hypothetical protein [Clostridia bacterium]